MRIDTTFLRRCIASLEVALEGVERHQDDDDFMYDIFRTADRLHFKDLFRHAAKHGLIDCNAAERWVRYRDNRNRTAHDYGKHFAEATLELLPAFIEDATALATVIEEAGDD